MGKKLKQQLVDYLRDNGGLVASGEIQRIYWPKYARGEKKGYHTPRSVVRRLEELTEEGKLMVEYRQNHAWYTSKEKTSYPKKVFIGATYFEVNSKEEEEKVRAIQAQGNTRSLAEAGSY